MKVFITSLLLLLLIQPAAPVERIEPALYICFVREIVIHKEPQAASDAVGHLLFGMPAVALARHNEWLGVYVKGGGKGWIQQTDMVTQKDFAVQYPHLAINDAITAQLIKDALQSTGKRQADNKLGELKFMKIKGESEEIYVRRDKVVIRSKPTLNSRAIRNTFLGEAFVAAGMVRGFYKIEYDDSQFGWISEDMVSPDTVEYLISMENSLGSPKEASLYVKDAADDKAPIIAKARRDFQYEILEENNQWYKIRLDAQRTGWVLAKDFRIVRPGLKNPVPSAETVVAKPSNTGQATGVPGPGAAGSSITTKPAPVPAPSPAPAPVVPAAPPAVSVPILPVPLPAAVPAPVVPPPVAVAVPDSPAVKAAEEPSQGSSPFAKLDSLKTLQNQEKAKQKELEKQTAEARQDSLAIKGKIETLKGAKMKELDSLRQALNNRFKYQKDSLAVEKEKFLKFQNSAETLDKLKKQKEALPGEITKLRAQAKDIRERAQNLKELAKFEFDIDTSARARDSLLKTSRALDSSAGGKETLLKVVEAEMVSLSAMKPEDAAGETARIDSLEKILPVVQKTEFTALLQKQAALDQMLTAARTQMVADAKERLKNLSTDLKAATTLIKKIDVEMAGLEREMRKKR